MKYLQIAIRIFTGFVFIFSGFVKAIDPQGSAIKFEEYFMAFNLDFLSGLALPLAILLSAAEFMIGFNLVTGVLMRFTSWLLMIFMSFFTVLTFILALTNPVSDCGCFGDAVKLTNWQTFWKNIIILIPSVFIFVRKDKYNPEFKPPGQLALALTGFAFSTMLSVYCIIHLPVVDFRPYKTGVNIPENMVIPEDAPHDEYEVILVYEKDGVKQEFTTENYPWNDSTWVWVETRQKLLKEGYKPPIYDFSLTTSEGRVITDSILASEGYTIMMIAADLDKADKRFISNAEEIYLKSAEINAGFYCITSSPENVIEEFRKEFNPSYPVCTADETTLKTIVRANPGIMIIRAGTILGKWNMRDFPEASELKPDLTAMALTCQRHSRDILWIFALASALSLLYLVVIRLLKK